MPENLQAGISSVKAAKDAPHAGEGFIKAFHRPAMLDPLCREYPPCAVSKRQQRIHLRVASIKRSCFFVSEIIPKPFLLRRVMSLWRGTALWPSESHSGQLGMPLWGEQRGRPSERRGASAKAI